MSDLKMQELECEIANIHMEFLREVEVTTLKSMTEVIVSDKSREYKDGYADACLKIDKLVSKHLDEMSDYIVKKSEELIEHIKTRKSSE